MLGPGHKIKLTCEVSTNPLCIVGHPCSNMEPLRFGIHDRMIDRASMNKRGLS